MLKQKTIEFTAKINQGMIQIPQEYSENLTEELEVEVMIKPKGKKRLMDELAENPIAVANWRELTREQIHQREDNE